MIPIPYEHGFTVYLIFWLFILVILWGREWRRNKANDYDLTKDRPCTCNSCQLIVMMKPDENISRCPRCNAICVLRKRR